MGTSLVVWFFQTPDYIRVGLLRDRMQLVITYPTPDLIYSCQRNQGPMLLCCCHVMEEVYEHKAVHY